MRHKKIGEYGQRFDERIPRLQIRWLVDREHVARTDEEIETLIKKRLERIASDGGTLFPAVVARDCVRYALAVHHANQELYRAVVTGRVG